MGKVLEGIHHPRLLHEVWSGPLQPLKGKGVAPLCGLQILDGYTRVMLLEHLLGLPKSGTIRVREVLWKSAAPGKFVKLSCVIGNLKPRKHELIQVLFHLDLRVASIVFMNTPIHQHPCGVQECIVYSCRCLFLPQAMQSS